MRPLALAIIAMACAGGPTIAIDFPGADPKVRAITTTSQPHATSAIAPAIRRSGGSRSPTCPSVVIEVLNYGTLGLEVAVNLDKTVDLYLEAGPAKAWPGVKLQ